MHVSAAGLAACTALLAGVNAHMIMKTPYPYGPDTLDKSPLQNGMGDFPCKQRPGVYDPPSQENNYAVGESVTLSFTGSAVHGGGSCQISLTTDKKPTKDSKWKVIHSIEGGCPANTAGNLPDENDATTFQFKIPDSISPGEYTLAWTWLNRIGNREYYMNCAPITVEGAKKKRYMPASAQQARSDLIVLDKRDDLPEMFVANINGCMTKESVDVRYPDPGPSVEYAGDPKNLMKVGDVVCSPGPDGKDPVAGAGSSDDPGSGSDSGSATSSAAAAPTSTSAAAAPATSQPVQSSPAVSAPATATEQPAATPTGGDGGDGNNGAGDAGDGAGYGGDGATPATGTPEAGAGASEAPEAPEAPESTAPAPASPKLTPGPAIRDPGSDEGSCNAEGAWDCIDGHSFRRCVNGQWTSKQPLADGVKCTVGQGSDLLTERDVAPNARRHIHHHRRSSHPIH
ncbi:hypothetical protein KEM52_000181 [Ascosphaera acerosa]|nr:hypothetical protein KEM52_000181 [Ascosphaera acerosa]